MFFHHKVTDCFEIVNIMTLLSSPLTMKENKLECLCQASFFGLVKDLSVKAEPITMEFLIVFQTMLRL